METSRANATLAADDGVISISTGVLTGLDYALILAGWAVSTLGALGWSTGTTTTIGPNRITRLSTWLKYRSIDGADRRRY